MNPRSWQSRAVDCLLVVLAGVLAATPFGDAFAGRRWLLAVVLGLLVAVAVTLLAHRLRWGILLTALAAFAGYLLVGPVAAAPQQAAGGFFPTADAERLLLTGLVESWRSVLTLPVPLGDARGELIVPFASALVLGLVATTLVLRSRFVGWVCLPVAALLLTACAFGQRDADLPLARGLALVVLLLAWLRWRELRIKASAWARRGALAAVLVAITGSTAWSVTSLTEAGERDVLRDHIVPPLAQLDFKSPLAKYRDYYMDHKDDVLFTFENVPADGPNVRLAAMDTFDGLVWNVSTTDLVTGSSAFRPAPYRGSGSTFDVTVGEDYAGPWVPTVGTATGALLESGDSGGRDLLINTATGSIAMFGDVRPGDSYAVEWEPRERRGDELIGVDADRSVPMVPMPFEPITRLDNLAQRAVGRAAANSDYERAVAIEAFFRDEGFFNDGDDPTRRGYSAPGHSVRRLTDLVADPKRMVGNDEQYAAAMAYALQRMSIPARVVLGFENVDEGSVTGDDIAAWVEVPFAGHGWISFDPAPPEEAIPPPQQDDPNPKPQPYVVQPPVLPQEPEDVDGVPPEGAGRDLNEPIWDLLWMILHWLWLGLRIALLLSPLWLFWLIKRIRRRRRRKARDPVVRLSGAWREVVDRARDLGTPVVPGGTRHEAGQLLQDRFPSSSPAVLATLADRHVFGPGVPTDEEVAAYWADVDSALKRMRRAVPWWRRPLAVLSPASIPWRAVGRGLRRRLGAPFRWVGRLFRRGK